MKRKSKLILAPVALAAGSYFTSGLWLPSVGSVLIEAEPPSKADAIVVLAGDGFGLRIKKGGELVREGYAPVALMSGPSNAYGHDEAELAISWAERQGFPRSYFMPVPNQSTSTEDEAEMMVAEVNKRGYHRILLVTSDYHTRRAGSIWRKACSKYGIDVHTVAAPDRDFSADSWWKRREGRKKLFFEWVKTLTRPFGA